MSELCTECVHFAGWGGIGGSLRECKLFDDLELNSYAGQCSSYEYDEEEEEV